MTRYLVFGVLLAVGACRAEDDYRDVVGPFTGATTTLAVDHFEYPKTVAQIDAVSSDLDGDGELDNHLGGYLQTLGSIGGDVATDVSGGGGAIAIQADDATDDATVGVTYEGAAGDDAIVVGGTLAGGAFAPNPSERTRVPGQAVVRLPIFVDADRTVVTMHGVEIEIAAPDPATGTRRAFVRGGIRVDEAHAAIVLGLQQMYDASPSTHTDLARLCDSDGDSVASDAEIAACDIVRTITKGDIQMFSNGHYLPHPPDGIDNGDVVSFAFAAVLAPTPAL